MVGFPGELLQGIAVAGQGTDFRIHLIDFPAVLFHLPFLLADFHAGPDPVEHAAVREEQQPQGHQRRYDEDERDEIVVVAAGQKAAFVFLVCHISG